MSTVTDVSSLNGSCLELLSENGAENQPYDRTCVEYLPEECHDGGEYYVLEFVSWHDFVLLKKIKKAPLLHSAFTK